MTTDFYPTPFPLQLQSTFSLSIKFELLLLHLLKLSHYIAINEFTGHVSAKVTTVKKNVKDETQSQDNPKGKHL